MFLVCLNVIVSSAGMSYQGMYPKAVCQCLTQRVAITTSARSMTGPHYVTLAIALYLESQLENDGLMPSEEMRTQPCHNLLVVSGPHVPSLSRQNTEDVK